jgi:hypothetical protein
VSSALGPPSATGPIGGHTSPNALPIVVVHSGTTTNIKDTGVPVDIALLEGDPLPRTQAGRCRERHESALTVAEPGGDLGELCPRSKRRFSAAAAQRSERR